MSTASTEAQVSCREVTELLHRIAAGADRPTVIGRRWADVHEGPVSFRMACGAQITVHKSDSELGYIDLVQLPGGRASIYDDWVDAEGGANPIDSLSVEQLRAIVVALRAAPVEPNPHAKAASGAR